MFVNLDLSSQPCSCRIGGHFRLASGRSNSEFEISFACSIVAIPKRREEVRAHISEYRLMPMIFFNAQFLSASSDRTTLSTCLYIMNILEH